MKNSGLESVDNALRLLLLLAQRDRVRVSDAASELGIALSTAHRLLSTLKQRGFVEQASDRSYVRGAAFAQLAGKAAPLPIEELARPHLERLCQDLQETVHLAVLDGTAMRFVLSVESDQALRVGSRVGVAIPAHRTSGGKAVLAALPPDELGRRLGPAGDLGSTLTPEEVSRLVKELPTVRRQGFGVNKAESERGIAAVGVPVLGARREPLAALSVSVPTVRMDPARLRRMVDHLARTRGEVERALAA